MSKPAKKNTILSIISREPVGMKCAICGIAYDNTLGVTLHMLCNCSAVCVICVKPIILSSVQNGGVSTNQQPCKKCGAMPKYRPYGYLRYRCLPIRMLPLWLRRVVCIIEFILTIALIVGEGKTQPAHKCNFIFAMYGGAMLVFIGCMFSCLACIGADAPIFFTSALLVTLASQAVGAAILYGTCGVFHVDFVSYLAGAGIVINLVSCVAVVNSIKCKKKEATPDDGA
jgi:hypothetical protein